MLVVAKYDRLTRDIADTSDQVFKSGNKINIIGLPPEAIIDPLLFGVYFGVAMREAQLISERTKAALRALKAQGVQLGRPDAVESITPEMTAAATEARRRKAAENPNNVASANEIRRYLNAGGLLHKPGRVPLPQECEPTLQGQRHSYQVSDKGNQEEPERLTPTPFFALSRKLINFAVPKRISSRPQAVVRTHIALCTVEVAETPSRFLIRPRTPKRRAFLFP